jgi:hypothetical protein
MTNEQISQGNDYRKGAFEMLREEDLIEQLLEEVVESEIEIGEDEIERAINYIPRPYQREMVQNYINYLEAVVESLE